MNKNKANISDKSNANTHLNKALFSPKKLGVLFVVFALVFGLGFLPGSAWGKDIKVLKIGIGIDPDTLLPFELTTMIPFNIAKLIYGSLDIHGAPV